MIQRDRFELLSAYLDGEVTAVERKQVEEWLAHDPTVQQLHSRLLKLRQAFQTMPVPQSERSVEETVDGVFSRVERRPKLTLIWGGAAIAALFMAALGTAFLGEHTPTPQIARSTDQLQAPRADSSDEPVLVALDRPLVAIPKAPVAEPAVQIRGTDGSGTSLH
jgi:anti-sigma factor RsiW